MLFSSKMAKLYYFKAQINVITLKKMQEAIESHPQFLHAKYHHGEESSRCFSELNFYASAY